MHSLNHSAACAMLQMRPLAKAAQIHCTVLRPLSIETPNIVQVSITGAGIVAGAKNITPVQTSGQVPAWEVSEWRSGSVMGNGGWLTHLLIFAQIVQIWWMADTFSQMAMR